MTRLMRCTILAFVLCAGLILLLTGCPTPEEPHVHTYAEAWSHDAAGHWHAATCGHADQKDEVPAHTYVEGVCLVCGRIEGYEYVQLKGLYAYLQGLPANTETTPYRIAVTDVPAEIEGAEIATTGTLQYKLNRFSSKSKYIDLILPESVTKIGDHAFRYGSCLTKVTISASVTSIGDYAFEQCHNLTTVTIPDSVTSIGKYAFSRCISLTSVTIPVSVTSIGDDAFYGCSSLTSVTIPASVTSIGDYAFWDCSSLASVTIPASVTRIGSMAFQNCSRLTSITFAGTTEQWAAVTKGNKWNDQVPATTVTCSDGTVAL